MPEMTGFCTNQRIRENAHITVLPFIGVRELRAQKAGNRLSFKVFLLFQHIDNITVELMSLSIGDL